MYYFKFTKDDNEKAVQLLEAAIAKDPDYARAYAMLAASYRAQAEFNWAQEPGKVVAKALEFARRGVAVDDRDPHAQQALGVTESYVGNHERGIAALRKAIEINPNRNFGHAQLALVLNWSSSSSVFLLPFGRMVRPARFAIARCYAAN